VGDIIRIFPVIMSLRKQFPQATLVSLSSFSATVYQLLPDQSMLDKCIEYDPRRLHNSLASKLRLAWSLRKHRFDLIVNPSRGEGMIENAIFSFMIGAHCRVGFEKNGAGFVNTVKVPLQDQVPITRQNLDLLLAVGVVPALEKASLRIPRDDLAYADAFIRSYVPPSHKVITIQPGNHWRQELRWHQDRYAEVIDGLAASHKCVIVLLGTQAEADLNQWILNHTKIAKPIDLAGQTSLTQMTAILSRSDLFIGNDSGPLHLALALEVPAIGIFGYTLPEQVISPTGPCIALRKGPQESLFLHEPFHDFKSSVDNPIEKIEVGDVLNAAETLLTVYS
jgi:ADP-heptose:LPS heptosyltransferase